MKERAGESSGPPKKLRRPNEKREGRTLLSKCVVMHSGAEREAGARDLRNPPETPKGGMAAGHQPTADIIHYGWADLCCRIDRIGVRKRAEQRVAFRAVVAGDGAASGVGVEGGGAVADGHKGVPEFLLSRRGHGTFHGRFDSSTRERLDGD